MFKLDVGYSVEEFISDVLKKRFPNDPIRQQINDTDSHKLNFACPYCGDSTHDPNKKRGHLYLDTQTYKCYNDGCSTWVPFEKFIKAFAPKYQLSIPELGDKKIQFDPGVSSKKKGFLIEFLINKEVGDKLLSISDIAQRFLLKPCADAPASSPIAEFVEKRKIKSLPVFEHSCYYDSREDKVYIFNLDLKSGKVIGFALRRISDSWPGPKYDIKNYTEFKKNGLIRNIEDDFIEKVNTINNYFNLLNVDFTKKVTITEGQIDAMFVKNCIATTGVTKSKKILGNLITKSNARILFDNDDAGRNESLALLQQGYSVFLWKKAIYSLRRDHPKFLRIINNDIKDVNDLYRFLLAQQPSLNFDQFNEWLDKYFSDSAFDMLLV